ncbi:MAG: hypothetical protein ACYS1E_01645 [Planctomycetota bacterium]|jgi:hypothetical protein
MVINPRLVTRHDSARYLAAVVALGVAAPVSLAEKHLLDPPPLPSVGPGPTDPAARQPRWADLDDFVPGETPPLLRSDPGEPPDGRRAPSRATTPPPRITFDGVIDDGSAGPPDTHIAVGPNDGADGRVVMVTNQVVGIWDKTGTFIASRDLSAMFGPGAFDPKILYDQHSGRFFIACIEGSSPSFNNIHIAGSTSDAPSSLYIADWTFLEGTGRTEIGGIDTWCDYPGIGSDALSLFVTYNLFDGSGVYRGMKIRVFDTAQLLGGTYAFVDLDYNDAVTTVSTTQPAHVFGATANGGFYLISRLSGSVYRLFHIAGHPAAPVATTGTFPWSAGNYPPDGGADQCDVALPDVDTLRPRAQNAVYRDGHIWCTMAADPDNDNRVEVVWEDVRANSYPSASPSVYQSGFIGGSVGGAWTYMPSLSVNAFGSTAIVFTQSSTVECPDIYYTWRESTDPLGSFQAPWPAHSSDGFYDSFNSVNVERWGDFSATVVDPTDDCFWLAQEYVFFSAPGASIWGTRIVSFCDDCNGNGIPDPDDLISGFSDDCNRNGIPDECDIAFGTSEDTNGNGIPDECETPPDNDECDNAQAVSDGTFAFTTVGATTDGVPETCSGGVGGTAFENDVWFLYTPECDGRATFSVCNDADFDTRLAVYNLAACPPFTDLGCSDDAPGCGVTSELEKPVFIGNQYLVRIGSGDVAVEGDGNLTITCEPFVQPCPCDCEDPPDGTVDVGDFLALLAQWGGPGPCDCEEPPDGVVDVGDFLALLATWGPCP